MQCISNAVPESYVCVRNSEPNNKLMVAQFEWRGEWNNIIQYHTCVVQQDVCVSLCAHFPVFWFGYSFCQEFLRRHEPRQRHLTYLWSCSDLNQPPVEKENNTRVCKWRWKPMIMILSCVPKAMVKTQNTRSTSFIQNSQGWFIHQTRVKHMDSCEWFEHISGCMNHSAWSMNQASRTDLVHDVSNVRFRGLPSSL